jgi:hypothetical protein
MIEVRIIRKKQASMMEFLQFRGGLPGSGRDRLDHCVQVRHVSG